VSLGLILAGVVFVFWYGFSPKNLNVGYMPKQPIAYSHALHAGKLGIDCRYCHVSVENTRTASLPSSEICLNCHRVIKKDSPEIKKIQKSFDTGQPIPWVRVHQLADYVYFDHSKHVNTGVACVTCHGHVDEMDTVRQVETLSMAWCLSCHRKPEANLRPVDQVTNMHWRTTDPLVLGKKLRQEHHINPKQDCSTCHR